MRAPFSGCDGAVFGAGRHEARHLGLGDRDFLAAPVGQPDVCNAIIVEMLAHASPGQSELNIRAGSIPSRRGPGNKDINKSLYGCGDIEIGPGSPGLRQQERNDMRHVRSSRTRRRRPCRTRKGSRAKTAGKSAPPLEPGAVSDDNNKAMPAAGPHARPDLTDPQKTPGTGSLPEFRQRRRLARHELDARHELGIFGISLRRPASSGRRSATSFSDFALRFFFRQRDNSRQQTLALPLDGGMDDATGMLPAGLSAGRATGAARAS